MARGGGRRRADRRSGGAALTLTLPLTNPNPDPNRDPDPSPTHNPNPKHKPNPYPDPDPNSNQVAELLAGLASSARGVTPRHLSVGPTRNKGNAQRSLALSWLKAQGADGVVYNLDDDNE